MTNERAVTDSQGCRREKRRRCNLIRLIRPIIDHPMVFRARLFGDEDAAHHLAKVLRAPRFHRWCANVVNQELIARSLPRSAQREAAFSGCLVKSAPTTSAAASRWENVRERTKIR